MSLSLKQNVSRISTHTTIYEGIKSFLDESSLYLDDNAAKIPPTKNEDILEKVE